LFPAIDSLFNALIETKQNAGEKAKRRRLTPCHQSPKYDSNESEDFPLPGKKKSIILDIRRNFGTKQGSAPCCIAKGRLRRARYVAKTAAETISARISRSRSKTGRREFLLERAEFQAIYGRGIREGANFREL